MSLKNRKAEWERIVKLGIQDRNPQLQKEFGTPSKEKDQAEPVVPKPEAKPKAKGKK